MRSIKYSDSEFIQAVKDSISIAEVCKKLGLVIHGGNYSTIKRKIKKLNLDNSHFTGQAHSKGKYFGPKRNIQDYLDNKVFINSNHLKKRLIAENLLEYRCYQCQNTVWNQLPIPLELEHIDGNNENNNLSNLTLLCPNCHAQTKTYRGKNIKTKSTKTICPKCNSKKSSISQYCRKCSNLKKSIKPSKEELIELIKKFPIDEIGRQYGITGNSVRRWCLKYNISYKHKDYEVLMTGLEPARS